MDWIVRSLIPGRGKRKTSGLALMPIQPLIQWVLEVLSLSLKSQGVKLTTDLCLVLWLKMSGSLSLLLLYAFMTAQE